MERNGIRNPGFDVEKALARLERVLQRAGFAEPTDHPLGHKIFAHLEQEHGPTTPQPECPKCGLLLAHWRLTEFLRSLEAAESQLALAEEAKKAAKDVRAAQKRLRAAWKGFEPAATDAHDRWERWPGVYTNHDDTLMCETAPAALTELESVEGKLDALSEIHTLLPDLQLAQPLGKKPHAQLLWEVEAALYDAGCSDRLTAGITQGRTGAAELHRIRVRRSEAQKDR